MKVQRHKGAGGNWYAEWEDWEITAMSRRSPMPSPEFLAYLHFVQMREVRKRSGFENNTGRIYTRATITDLSWNALIDSYKLLTGNEVTFATLAAGYDNLVQHVENARKRADRLQALRKEISARGKGKKRWITLPSPIGTARRY